MSKSDVFSCPPIRFFPFHFPPYLGGRETGGRPQHAVRLAIGLGSPRRDAKESDQSPSVSRIPSLKASRMKPVSRSVPDDIPINGFDDIPMASQVHPSLTTIRQPFPQMARAAVNTLVAHVGGANREP
ncbi:MULTISPECIES: substrate-binding domain-containing protein [Burkholderia]|uniref:substrate-binding domain-containing protein n=1 Tax=Burkholderia TaxID=32008 RepID=UPI0012E3514F|nr:MULTISPECIES: substrate-binding domain-containing protein [Burkholderia]